MGEFVFHVPLRGNVALLFGTSAIFLTWALAMGILISIVTKSQLLSSQVAIVATFLPAFLLSGFIFTIANMPRPIQIITYIVPALFRHDPEGYLPKGIGLEILFVPWVTVRYGAAMVLLAN
jgi:ABC-2 type transport system permease protein